MKSFILITAFGEDRPGIVARLTEVLTASRANLEDSRMSILGGEFAAIALASVPNTNLAKLQSDLTALKDEGITTYIKLTTATNQERFKNFALYELTLEGADHEGIVHHVTSLLRSRNINVHSLDTHLENAPETGTPLFGMKAVLQVPKVIALSELRELLRAVSESQCVEIKVNALPGLLSGKTALRR